MSWILDGYNPTSWGDHINSYTGASASENQKQANQISVDNAARNIALQKEFAQMGIQWKVQDARAAGINPLAALGASTASFSPVSIGQDTTDHAGAGMRNLGQDIQRAISSTSTAEQRQMQTLQVQGAQLDLQGKAIDNQIKQTQLNKIQGGPSFPSESFIDGQGNSGSKITTKPMERTASSPGAPWQEPGSMTDVGWATTPTGLIPVPSKDIKERIEDNMPQEWSHFFRNNVAPVWGGGPQPPSSALPKGATGWEYNPMKMEFQPKFPQDRTGLPDRPGFDWRGSKNPKQNNIRRYK